MVRIPRMKPKRYILLLLVFSLSLVTLQVIIGAVTGNRSEQIIFDMVQLSAKEMVQPDRDTVIQGPAKSKRCEDLGRSHYLLFMIITAPENREQRQAIRTIFNKVYGNWERIIMENNKDMQYQRGATIRALFFVGRTNEDSTITVIDLIQEAKEYGDMVIDNFFESYLNLTIKTLRMLKWVEAYCPRVPFLVKIDDDVYFNGTKVLGFLHNITSTSATPLSINLQTDYHHPGQDLIAGYKYNHIQKDSDPTSKWYTPSSVWGSDALPDFVGGFCYILGSRVRSQLYHGALKKKLFHLEDVFITGIVRDELQQSAENNNNKTSGGEGLKFNLVDVPGIHKWWKAQDKLTPPRSIDAAVIHPLSPKEILCYHQTQEDYTNNYCYYCNYWLSRLFGCFI